MNPANHRLAYSTFGTIAIAFFAFSIFLLVPKDALRKPVPALIVDKRNVSTEQEITSVGVKPFDDEVAQNKALPGFKSMSAETDTHGTTDQIQRSPQPNPESANTAINPLPSSNVANSYLEEMSVGAIAVGKAKRSDSSSQGPVMRETRARVLAAPQSVASDLQSPPQQENYDREEYAHYQTNPIVQVAEQAVSTFSIDVDTASYSLIRNQLNNGYLPKPQAVRAEELINYFDYDYPLPSSKSTPFAPTITVQNSPWNEGRKLVHIGIKGYEIEAAEQPDSNLVFLLDVSGSMNQPNKLPLVKQSMALLLETLKPNDLVSIVVYAGAAGVVLEPTAAKQESKIMAALQSLNAGGSTAGGAGIRLAYQLAEQNLKKDGVNRILLATDGDFNVGQSSNEDLKTLVERKRDNGVFLSVLGFGRNNYQDDMMQTLAQNGNGIAAYIDTLSEAKKVLVDEATSTLFPIAKDVKIQVEFNPAAVSDYRLVGYETRALKREDFNNDKVDAGDIGAGHTVTAIYEITPADSRQKAVDDLRYQAEQSAASGQSDEYGFLKIRYKLPKESKSRLIETAISTQLSEENTEVQYSIAVAGFAQLLSNSQYIGDLSYDDVIQAAQKNKGKDEFGYRSEFVQLARMAKIAKP